MRLPPLTKDRKEVAMVVALITCVMVQTALVLFDVLP